MAAVIMLNFPAEVAHLVLQLRERTEVMDFSLFVERGDRLGAGDLAARRVHRGEGQIRIDHPQGRLDHFTAVVDLGDDPVGAVCAISGNRRLRPLDRLITPRKIG